jgi:hypothetical protein
MTADSLTRERVAQIVRAMPLLVGAADAQNSGKLPPDVSEKAMRELLEDYYRVMEIAHYIRRGGVKAMIYRVETGRTTFVQRDYFDEAHEHLIAAYREIFTPPDDEQPVLERLSAVTEQEEEIVKEFLPEIDHLLLSDKRKEAAMSEDL